jgi:hypothetical protein
MIRNRRFSTAPSHDKTPPPSVPAHKTPPPSESESLPPSLSSPSPPRKTNHILPVACFVWLARFKYALISSFAVARPPSLFCWPNFFLDFFDCSILGMLDCRAVGTGAMGSGNGRPVIGSRFARERASARKSWEPRGETVGRG